MSKSLVKFLDNALLPASLMIVAKFVGVILTIQIFNINWVVEQTPNNFFSFQTILSGSDVVTVTSYSDLLMYSALALGFTINLVRAIYFHTSHISSSLLTKLMERNLIQLVKSSYEIYHAASTWLFFLWIATIVILSNSVSGTVYTWVALASFGVSTVLSIIFFQDVYKEIEYAKKHPGKYLN